ncbi:DUF885 domain-containing protein [Undibacterium sp. TS12]|uniref:DUF885 domain-containing protein n=1 Tax=Undibacterium sp. TS12 TaxID=2908202 RepID=UPI001F4C87BA|nr:DUF885 domain-containing protein [Undibacterium sp. TS12]MCH8619929.1 DUF885 domain-containing protein [Undibacterium sp. TS12]
MPKLCSLTGTLISAGIISYSIITGNALAAEQAHTQANQVKTIAAAKLESQRLLKLADYYYEKQTAFDPMGATYNGDSRYDDLLPQTLLPSVKAKQVAMWKDVASKLAAIRRDQLSVNDLVTYDCLDFEIRANLELAKFDQHLLPINQMDSLPVTLAHFASGQNAQPLKTVKQYEIFLRRLEKLPTWLHQAKDNMRIGIKRGIVLPKALVNSALPQYAQLVTEKLEDHAYFVPVKNFPAEFSDKDKQRLGTAYRQVLSSKVLPALREFQQFLANDYLAASRTSSGLGALPDGDSWYRTLVRDQTTTNLDPETIHGIGLKEVARIQSEFVALGPRLGYHGDPVGLPAWIDTQPQYRPYKTEAEVLDGYRQIEKLVVAKLPELFSKTPKAALDIRAEPEISRQTASDHYTQPAYDGSRPGVFWAVINNPADYSTTGMKTLYLHEGQPGHHFHLARSLELDIPKFRKFGGNNAYTEGWALYAETLGREMGLFENDPNAYLGHLTDELLRATRLVVDTGLHAKGWTREQAIQYQQATLGYSEAASRQATERYMAWPGQALGYKIGSLKIVELRQRAATALGKRFDLRQFHEVVLSDGTLPLALLEAKVNKWIDSQKTN